MPTNSRRRSSKLAAEPLDLDEIEQDPGFRGMLSFLKASPEENRQRLALRKEADRQSPMGESSVTGSVISGENPQDGPPTRIDSASGSLELAGLAPPIEVGADAFSRPELPMGQSPLGDLGPMPIPSMEVEGRGKRALRYCRTVQDGHTSSEELAYEALWAHARRHGQTDTDGSRVVDLALSQLRTILNTDHKNVKRLLMSLKSKLVLEIVRPPDYRRAISTRYRIFNQGQILERRRTANMLWVVRTRAVRFVPMEVVDRLLLDESTTGESPMGPRHGV
jgi:hypothetical protein